MCFIKLRENIDNWREIGASDAVIETIEKGVSLPFSVDKESVAYHLKSRPIKKDYLPFVQSEIVKLQTSGVIEECDINDIQVLSPLSVVPKRGVTSRANRSFG